VHATNKIVALVGIGNGLGEADDFGKNKEIDRTNVETPIVVKFTEMT